MYLHVINACFIIFFLPVLSTAFCIKILPLAINKVYKSISVELIMN